MSLQPENRPFDIFDYDQAVELLVARGCPREQVLGGSMPRESLELTNTVLRQHLSGRKIYGLHIGNFLGISLASITSTCKSINTESLVVGIDPNIPHRGILNPAGHVAQVLSQAGVTKNVILLAAYSLEKNISNDGVQYSVEYDPGENWPSECACENGLNNLARLSGRNLDFALLDGNHDGSYLARELREVDSLLRPGGLLILDDVCDSWAEIQGAFNNLPAYYTVLAKDGRIGIAQKGLVRAHT